MSNSVSPDVLDELDIVLPFPEHTALELRNEIGFLHGGMLQLRVWLDRALRADQESRIASDARLGGVDQRLDKLEERMSAIEAKLDRALELLTEG